jgi:hypothetical protein
VNEHVYVVNLGNGYGAEMLTVKGLRVWLVGSGPFPMHQQFDRKEGVRLLRFWRRMGWRIVRIV